MATLAVRSVGRPVAAAMPFPALARSAAPPALRVATQPAVAWTALWRRLGLRMGEWEPVRAFGCFARRRPFVASGVTASITLGSTDFLVQRTTLGAEAPLDRRRTLSMVAWGLVWYGGPQQFLWTRLYPGLIGRGTRLQAMVTAFADCFINMAVFYLPCFYMFTGLVKGQTPVQAIDQFKQEYYEALFGMAGFWLPIQFCNFYVVPVHLQTFVVTTANVVNKSWLSWMNNRRRAAEQQALMGQGEAGKASASTDVLGAGVQPQPQPPWFPVTSSDLFTDLAHEAATDLTQSSVLFAV